MSSLAYAYTDGMNLMGISDGVTPANNNTLWYTAANRLQNANGPWGNTENYYDFVGNRTYNINTVGAVATTRVQAYAASSNRLDSMTENTTAFSSYTHDTAGNTLTENLGRNSLLFRHPHAKPTPPVNTSRSKPAYTTTTTATTIPSLDATPSPTRSELLVTRMSHVRHERSSILGHLR